MIYCCDLRPKNHINSYCYGGGECPFGGDEGEMVGVKEVALGLGEGGASVEGVAEERVAYRGEVNANLVPAGTVGANFDA